MDATNGDARPREAGMSYKFQRLRERLRQAIASGELAGKLPGERALAKRFHVNAKTLSKALTDLAAEGVLDRSIGRGTYVKGSAPAPTSSGRWLLLCDPDDVSSPLVEGFRAVNQDLQVATETAMMRPSFLNQFSAVIDASSSTPDAFLRDLVVRNLPLVAVNREPRTYSMHTVLIDTQLGVLRIGRAMGMAGHRRFAAVEPRGQTTVVNTLQSAMEWIPDAIVEPCDPAAALAALEGGATGFVCASTRDAELVKAALSSSRALQEGEASVGAVGMIADAPPCGGYFVRYAALVEPVIALLQETCRPTTLWLAGDWYELEKAVPNASDRQESAAHPVSEVLA